MLGFIVSRAKFYSDKLLLFCNIILLLLVFTTFFCVPIIFIRKSLTREFLFVSFVMSVRPECVFQNATFDAYTMLL